MLFRDKAVVKFLSSGLSLALPAALPANFPLDVCEVIAQYADCEPPLLERLYGLLLIPEPKVERGSVANYLLEILTHFVEAPEARLHLTRQLQRAGLPRHLPSLVTLPPFNSCANVLHSTKKYSEQVRVAPTDCEDGAKLLSALLTHHPVFAARLEVSHFWHVFLLSFPTLQR
jgi:hypothetical protein